jgi:thioredoxin 1
LELLGPGSKALPGSQKIEEETMKSTKRPGVSLVCLWVMGFWVFQTTAGWAQIQTPLQPRPTILEFSREYCPMCEYMAKTLGQLKSKYGSQIDVRLLHFDPDENLFKQYKIVFVPTQVFLDASGKEVFRHTGLFTPYELTKKLKELKLIRD